MSDIPKSERSESPLRAQHMIYNIRKRITAELMATFGYSQKRFEKHIKAVTAYVVNEEEREELAAKIREQEEDFNLWFIQQERARVLTFCQDISVHMRAANTIWPDYWSEYEAAAMGQGDGVLQYAPGRAPIYRGSPSGRQKQVHRHRAGDRAPVQHDQEPPAV